MWTDSFLLATDAGLTTEFGGFEDTEHFTDESDNPQDLTVLYFGSQNVARAVKASSDPGVDDIILTPTDILPIWVLSSAVVVGQMCQPTSPNGYRYQCTTAGTTDATEPASWPLSISSTVIDGTAVWTCISPKHEITEITLATDPGDLATNTPGDPLSLGNTINGGTSNKVAIYIRVENNINIPSNNSTYPEISIQINGLNEYTI